MRTDRRRLQRVLMILSATCVVASAAQAQQIVAITNPSITLSASDLRDAYLGEKLLADGTPLLLLDNASVQEAFLAKVVRLNLAKYNATWTKKAFREGITPAPPPLKLTDDEVIDFVRRSRGAVGYIRAAAPAGVNVVRVE